MAVLQVEPAPLRETHSGSVAQARQAKVALSQMGVIMPAQSVETLHSVHLPAAPAGQKGVAA